MLTLTISDYAWFSLHEELLNCNFSLPVLMCSPFRNNSSPVPFSHGNAFL